MNNIEYFDIYNENMFKIGKESRQRVHSLGLWHQTFHCWIIKDTPSEGLCLLFQLRHKDKDIFPSLLDISCAGHLQTGEAVEDGVRELEEELGLSVLIDDLIYCGMVAQEHVVSSHLVDREFNHVFIYESNKSLRDYHIQKDEITGLFWIALKDFKELLNGERDHVASEGIIADEVSGLMLSDTRELRRKDFTPISDEYFKVLFAKMERM
ncbi:NUDIX hydrolase [Paenibacillus segetis]|uniref:Nudix hydrolase n=1 Tax=Paenibacillus segetis TaxID=1325360 RepID=A0ABQ1YJQ7_9BACL|nr:NUDIX domain-containing protein [Paenibacillus segetis]GGH27041.1 putative Nudix hydrolase [Paenibacillus segetis]